MAWKIQAAGHRYRLFDMNEQRTLEGVAFVRMDRAERVRHQLELNDADEAMAIELSLAKLLKNQQP